MAWIRAVLDLLFCLVGFAIGLAALQFLQEALREAQGQHKFFNGSGPGVAESGGSARNTPMSFEERDGCR